MNPNFDWNQFQSENESAPQNQTSFDWSSQPEFKEQEKDKSFIEELPRHASRIGSRIAETLGGIPGDVSKLIESGVFSGLEKITGFPATAEMKEKARQKRLPTSSELKEFSQKHTKEFTSPKNKTEKSIDEFVETAASLFGPMKFRKVLGVALGSQVVKEGLKELGVGESSQEAGKLGTMFVLSSINPKGAMKYASSQYKLADNLAKGASISAPEFEKNLLGLQESLKKGITTPAKNIVLKPTEELIGKIKNGKIPVQDLTAAKRDINTLMGDPSLLKRERNLLKGLGSYVDKAIKPFEKINPEFSKAYRPANEIYGAITQGNKASNFISKAVGPKSVLGAIAGEVILGHPEFIAGTLATAGVVTLSAKAVDFFTRLSKSPELQKYYAKAMTAALSENTGSLRTYSDKIDKFLEENTNNSQ
jgi:hypothetical protein